MTSSMKYAVQFSVFAALLLTLSVMASSAKYHQFCIIGAGPGGLQTAYFMKQLGMDFVLIERNAKAGSFFQTYPRQRQLISINKVYTGVDDPEFNLRHDWNSLLVDDATPGVEPRVKHPLLFNNFSRKFYPPADALVDYLNEFATIYNVTSQTLYSTKVEAVGRRAPAAALGNVHAVGAPGNFVLQLRNLTEERNWILECQAVVLATGKDIPIQPKVVKGAELLTGYETASADPAQYENKRLLVLGNGNAALEFARWLESRTAAIHLASRTPMKLAHQTHYVGHGRALNLGFLDRYQFMSQDALLPGLDVTKTSFVRNKKTGRIHVEGAIKEGLEWYDPFAPGYDAVIRCLGFIWDHSIFNTSIETSSCGCNDGTTICPSQGEKKASSSSCGQNGDDAGDLGPLPVVLEEDRGGRYPIVASNYESVNVPNFFVSGNLMHFRDFKKSSGGFIHGFRYLARTLVHQMNERYNGVPYSPIHQMASCRRSGSGSASTLGKACIERVVNAIFGRLSNVSSLYQMQSVLADVIVLQEGTEGADVVDIVAIQDIPLDQVGSRNPNSTNIQVVKRSAVFLTVSLEFGPFYQGSGSLYHQGQEETDSRKAEKKMWDEASDPDIWLRDDISLSNRSVAPSPERKGVTTSSIRRGVPRLFQEELQPLEPLEILVPSEEEEDDDEDPALAFSDPEVARRRERILGDAVGERQGKTKKSGGRSKFGEQFLHPVIRMWRRDSSTGIASKVPPESNGELRLLEDLHNEWSLPKRHGKPLREYLTKVLHQLR